MNMLVNDKNKLDEAINNLSQYVNNKDIFDLTKRNVGIGLEIKGDLSKKIYRQSYYNNCIFDSANCKSIGFSGSKFINTNFKNCNLENGNLHSCDFKNVTIEGYGIKKFKMKNIGFHKSTFTDCLFQNLYIFSCGFTDVVFYNTTFSNCTIKLSSLENTQFINCRFINLDMSTLNLEYTEFNNIYAKDCIFPFATIPSAFGLLQQLSLLDESNTIYSANNTEHSISISKYIELLKDFECYYRNIENFYALSNIYIALNQVDQAYETITVGILNTIKLRDYRILRHLCKLVYLSNMFTPYQRRKLYEKITLWTAHENLSISEYHNYQIFLSPIRELLLNSDYNHPTLFFYLKTNINPNELQKQMILLDTIDSILAYCNMPISSIQLTHNSAYVDFLNIVCESFSQLSQVLIMIYGSLAGLGLFATGIKKLMDSAQNTVLNHDKHITNKLEQEKLKLEISSIQKEQEYKEQMNKLEYNKAVLELQKSNFDMENMLQKSKAHNQILLENDICVSVSHASRNLHCAPIPEMMQYTQQH